ncbi:YiaA/YiaB family inner membrane protein [Plantactinospora sp. GCM10030261]|uniref:YiaA/YiaB family inner membrane protein n=1 Tax=Plantactinospora sp. GCM10030261 TaxID=3273420 RepID=UPI00361C8740
MSASVQRKPTPAFTVQAGLSFAISLVAMVVGIVYLPVNAWMRGFLALGLLYVVTSSLTLAKTIRDQQESSEILSRVDQARLEKLLAEHDPFRAAAS